LHIHSTLCVFNFFQIFAMQFRLPNWCSFNCHIFALVLWLVVRLQQVWDLLLLCLFVLVGTFTCCCAWVWGEFIASPIPLAFEHEKYSHASSNYSWLWGMENRAIMLWSRMMVVRSKVVIAISTMAHACALMLLFLPTLDVFWSYFALLQLGGHFDDGGTSKAMLAMSSTCTSSLFMLL